MKTLVCLAFTLSALSALAAEPSKSRGGAPSWLKKMVKPIVKRASITTVVTR